VLLSAIKLQYKMLIIMYNNAMGEY